MLIDLREAIRREVDVLDRIELVAGVIRRGNLFRDQLLVHLPHDELPVAEQRCAIGGRIEFCSDADTRPPQHHRCMLEAPVNRDPARLPRFENDLAEFLDVPLVLLCY